MYNDCPDRRMAFRNMIVAGLDALLAAGRCFDPRVGAIDEDWFGFQLGGMHASGCVKDIGRQSTVLLTVIVNQTPKRAVARVLLDCKDGFFPETASLQISNDADLALRRKLAGAEL